MSKHVYLLFNTDPEVFWVLKLKIMVSLIAPSWHQPQSSRVGPTGQCWILDSDKKSWNMKKKFFYQLFNIIQQQKMVWIFFFFSKFSHGRLPSWHQLPPGRSALPGQRAWWGNFGQRQNGMKYIRTLFLRSLKYRTTKKNWSKIFRIT